MVDYISAIFAQLAPGNLSLLLHSLTSATSLVRLWYMPYRSSSFHKTASSFTSLGLCCLRHWHWEVHNRAQSSGYISWSLFFSLDCGFDVQLPSFCLVCGLRDFGWKASMSSRGQVFILAGYLITDRAYLLMECFFFPFSWFVRTCLFLCRYMVVSDFTVFICLQDPKVFAST